MPRIGFSKSCWNRWKYDCPPSWQFYDRRANDSSFIGWIYRFNSFCPKVRIKNLIYYWFIGLIFPLYFFTYYLKGLNYALLCIILVYVASLWIMLLLNEGVWIFFKFKLQLKQGLPIIMFALGLRVWAWLSLPLPFVCSCLRHIQ